MRCGNPSLWPPARCVARRGRGARPEPRSLDPTTGFELDGEREAIRTAWDVGGDVGYGATNPLPFAPIRYHDVGGERDACAPTRDDLDASVLDSFASTIESSEKGSKSAAESAAHASSK